MRIIGHPYNVLSTDEINSITNSALRILEEMGMEIHNPVLLKEFDKHGWEIDFDTSTVKFPVSMVKSYIQKCGTYDWSHHKPQVSSTAGVYHGLYLDPLHNTRTAWTEEILSTYFALADHLLCNFFDPNKEG